MVGERSPALPALLSGSDRAVDEHGGHSLPPYLDMKIRFHGLSSSHIGPAGRPGPPIDRTVVLAID